MTNPADKSQVNSYADDFVDVRDVADAVLASLKADKAGGERFILNSSKLSPYCPLSPEYSREQLHIPGRTYVG
jgi:hypothetical protein